MLVRPFPFGLWLGGRRRPAVLREHQWTNGHTAESQREIHVAESWGPGTGLYCRGAMDAEKGCDSEKDQHWVGLAPGEPIPTTDLSASWRHSCRNVSGKECGKELRSVSREEEQRAGTVWRELRLTAHPVLYVPSTLRQLGWEVVAKSSAEGMGR